MKMEIKLCIVSPSFHPNLGGVGRQAVQLSSLLSERGVKLFVLTRKMKNMPEFQLPSDIEVYHVPALRPAAHNLEDRSFLNFLTSCSFSFMLALKLFRRRKQYNLVHFHGASIPLIVSLPLLKLLGKKVIAKVLASGLGTEAGSFKDRYFFIGNILARIMKSVDSFIAISEEIAHGLLNDGASPDKIKRISNFVDIIKFCPSVNAERHRLRSNLSIDHKIVMNFTGRIVKRKGLDVLLKAISEKKETLLSSILIVVGTGTGEDEMKQLASKLGISENIKFLGHRSEVVKYYNASELFVFPSYQEGLPNALLEAMACGLPVIASKIGGVVDIVEDGRSGVLFEPGDVSGLASAMVRLLNDNELRQKLGAEARKRIVENFAIDRIADEYIKLYEEVLH